MRFHHLRRAAAALAVLALVQVSPASGAIPDDARQLLEGMAEAVHELNYEGTFIYRHNGNMQTMRIYHGAYPEGEKERLVSLSGPRREVLRDEDRVTCLLPQSKSLVVDEARSNRPFPISVPTRLEELGSHYDVRVEGADRIAGIEAQKIIFRPADRYRYGQSLWIDRSSGLPLRAEMLDEKGNTVEQIMFTDLKVHAGELPAELLKPEISGKDWVRKEFRSPAGAPQTQGPVEWEIGRLPPGFTRDVHLRHATGASGQPVEHLVFSDGLASVSVFIESAQGGTERLSGLSHMGAVHAFGRQLDSHRVIVVGEVPADTVRLIAEGVRRTGSGGGD